MWPVCLCLLAAAALSGAEDQRQRLAAVDQPPAHVVYGLLVEPWLNASSRHRRARLQEPVQQLEPAAEQAVRQQALVTAVLLSRALDRGQPVTAEGLQRVLAEYDAASPEQQRRLLNASLTELGERLHGPVIHLEALLIAQQTELMNVLESVAALRDKGGAHNAITNFVNSVTATLGRRVSAAEADISRLGDSLRQLNTSLVSGQDRRQDRSEPDGGERQDPVPETELDSAEQETDQETDLAAEMAQLRRQASGASRRCCDRLEARLARLETAAADRDQLADRLDAALSRLQALEEQQALLLRSGPVAAGESRVQPYDAAAEADLSAAGTEPRGALLVGEDSASRPTSRDNTGTPLTGDIRRSGVAESDIITADSVVTADGRQATVVLGRSIQVTDSAGPRSRSGLPPQTPVSSGRSLHLLLTGEGRSDTGTPESPQSRLGGGWGPVPPAGDRGSRLLTGEGRRGAGTAESPEQGGWGPVPLAGDRESRLLTGEGRSGAGTPESPEQGGWGPVPLAGDRESRLLPTVPPASDRAAAAVETGSQAETDRSAGTSDAGDTAEEADSVVTGADPEPAGGDQQAESSAPAAAVATVPPPPLPGSSAEEVPRRLAAVDRAGVAPRRGQAPVLDKRRLSPTRQDTEQVLRRQDTGKVIRRQNTGRQDRQSQDTARQDRLRPVSSASGRFLTCWPTRRYSAIVGMAEWCVMNCGVFCPPSHCVCQWAQ